AGGGGAWRGVVGGQGGPARGAPGGVPRRAPADRRRSSARGRRGAAARRLEGGAREPRDPAPRRELLLHELRLLPLLQLALLLPRRGPRLRGRAGRLAERRPVDRRRAGCDTRWCAM